MAYKIYALEEYLDSYTSDSNKVIVKISEGLGGFENKREHFSEEEFTLLKILEQDEKSRITEEGYIEGKQKEYYINRYERNIKNKLLAIKYHGLTCVACGFNFEKFYGEHGANFIEIHHIHPLSYQDTEKIIDPKTDLVPLCANCHRMIHRQQDRVLSIEELKAIIRK